ncbi:DUF4347 domain-containing protein [Nostoc sp. WHI]|uniref:DUF4347 domain-containing protein n=1 Tax=Nostoc sp. WHI TaxID=2650611 RepID=UPI001E4BFBAC|nr:DUF4347 domain-containing protein [Nostoc sp. WHI]MBG1266917.1 DUF4347 domain-containing protein [Nostoc sp. WHI]
MVTLHSLHSQVNPEIFTSYTHSLVFIDMAVEDYSGLVNGVLPNTEVFVIDSTRNGVEQITEILTNCNNENLSSIHIVCHGAPGYLQLGNTHLGLDTLDEYSQQLQQWQKKFLASSKTDNSWNLLIYGCNVAFGDAGAEFIDKLHQLTKANIAASRQPIGNAVLGGSWELDVRTSDMEVNLAFAETTRQNYAGVLATFTVNDIGDVDDGDRNNGITTLREAINLANATAGADAIAFGGIFTDITPDTITLTSGQLTITDDTTILGTGASQLTVSGNNASRVFEISGLATGVSIDGLAIASGAIRVNRNSILSLANSSVSGNTGITGISNNGILSLTNTSVFGNTKGGIYNGGFLSLTNSSVYGNTGGTAVYNGNIAGGGIFNDGSGGNFGTLNLINSSISGNTANSGGGIYNQGGTLSLTNSSVSGNTANSGGGIFNGDDGGYSAGSVTLTKSTVSGNTALEDGGGIYNGYSYVETTRLTLINTTITNNTADSDNDGTGNGGGVIVTSSSDSVNVSNTIIAGNFDNSTSGDIHPDIDGGLIDSGNNLIGNNTGSTAFTTSILVGTSVNPIDPKLGLLQNNGGATLTHALLAGSPAIDAGNNSLVPTGITTDQRGAGFDRIFNGVVDIGAYEVQPLITPPPVNTDTVVTNTNDSGAGSLRQAILNANATAGADTITFAGVFTDATPDIIALNSGKLTITDDIIILGTGASNLTISGNNILGVFEILGTGTDASIDGLKIANANDALGSILLDSNASLSLTNSIVSDNIGAVGGIFNRGILSLTNTTVSGNRGSSLGGGIFNKGNLSLNNSTVSNNRVNVVLDYAYGGGIFNIGNLSITNSTISNNIVDARGFERAGPNPLPSYGGGIYNSGTVNLTNSTVSGSTAQSGGGIFNSGIFNLSNSTISGNQAYSDGGGISNSGTLTLTNSTITNNTAEVYNNSTDGGGIFNSSDGTVIVGNTIIAGNFDDDPNTFGPDVFGNFTDIGNNLIGDRTGSTGFSASTLVGTSANPIDPKLSALQNNGGATLTHALLADSPAINAGNNALLPVSITTDQRGAGFDRISEGTVDIGALEFNELNGTNGADNLVGNNYGEIINAQAGNDIITGNQGNDILTGGGGKDKFVYNLGDGVDTITDFGGLGKGSNPLATIIDELDTLKFQGTGLTARNLLLTQNANNLEITFEGVADDKVILQNFALENLDNLWTLGNIVFNGQTKIHDSFDVFNANSTQSTIFNKNTVTFLNDLNNNIDGFDNSADVINGLEGDDRINGKSGNDLIRGGTGNDSLIGGAGNDILVSDLGNDSLIGGVGNDILLGDLGNDSLIGGDGNDILLGGRGNDILTGGSGNDQFIYQTFRDVSDIITDFNQSKDKLVFTDLFKSQGYTSTNPIGDGYLQFVQSGTSTQVNSNYYPLTLVTLDNFTATNLVVGTNVIV